MPRLFGCAERVSAAHPPSSIDFIRHFRLLILLAWLIPPLFGMSFLLLIGMFSLPQILQLLVMPLVAGFVLGWLLLSQWYFSRFVRPLEDWLAQPDESTAAAALARVQAFPRHFWGAFLFYLLLAPASVIVSAEMAMDFEATSGDWLRIHLVALIAAIIVGLPVFFAVFDLFGCALSGLRLPRPLLSIRTRVFILGAVVPLLVTTLLLQYYWTRTGYFGMETLFVWAGLQLLAVLGALMFARGLGQPMDAVVENVPALLERRPSMFHKADEFARSTLQSIADGVVTTDTEGRVDYLNAVAEKLTGWTREEAMGQPLATVLRLIDEDSDEPVADPVVRCLASADSFPLPGQLNLLNRGGDKEFAVEVRVSAIRDADHLALGVVLVFHDTTELTSLTHRLSYQASHDSLTGLINRHEFEARLELALESARHESIEHVLCYMDLDRFKVVNDTCGHVAGDELLKQLATRMRASIREADILARLGGDEFGLLLEGCHLEQACGVVNNLLQMVSEFRFVWADKAFDVGISIGLAPISAQSGNITDVLSAADSACYIAKDQGRNRLHVFEQDDLALLHQKGEMQWLQIIRQALENDDFVLYQQAIRPMKGVPPAGDDTPHSEILLRLRTGEGEVVAPSSFLPAAERYHLMPQIDRWVVTQVLAFLHTLQAQGGVMNLSINLSGQSLCDEDFPAFVTTAVLASGIPPKWLCFEVTETTAITNLSRAVSLISELKRMGCHFALDDFGSGLSSFNYLKNLPVDYLKIDGSFVKDMDRNPVDRAMVAAINEIGHLMGIQTVAEFVTRLGVLEALDEIGVDYAQGYFIATPEPLVPE